MFYLVKEYTHPLLGEPTLRQLPNGYSRSAMQGGIYIAAANLTKFFNAANIKM
jgi:hypothetical protein